MTDQTHTQWRKTLPTLLAVLPCTLVAGCQAQPQGDGNIKTASASQIAQARAQISGLVVKGRSGGDGYSRALFLPHNRWPAVGHGCTVRDRIVVRDLTHLETERKRPCHPVSGILLDPYSGDSLGLGDVELDHVVALKDAYVKGGRPETFTPTDQWPTVESMRHALAVDPDNLLMVSGQLNATKRHADAASWVPPNKSYRCTYAVKITIIKARYKIWVTRAEKSELARYIAQCPH